MSRYHTLTPNTKPYTLPCSEHSTRLVRFRGFGRFPTRVPDPPCLGLVLAVVGAAQAVAVVGWHPPETCLLAFEYGRHLGLAFQIVDDVLDFTAKSGVLGKPTLNDLRSGLTTAPVLFAAEEFPGLEALVKRKFKSSGDVETVRCRVQGLELRV